MSKELFEQFRKNLAVRNAEDISRSYRQITGKLNEKYYETDSTTLHCRQVGSYGRHTAVHGISDLDMAFVLPWEVYDRFQKYENNKQSSLLGEIRLALKDRFPNHTVRAQQQVVSVDFTDYIVEILPAFMHDDGSYTYPDANDGGCWRTCNPVAEIDEINNLNQVKNHNLKRLCKMVRAWKNDHGVPLKGMLIDTLCYQFLKGTTDYDEESYSAYGEMSRDFFAYLVGIDEEKDQWRAPGSGSTVTKSGHFHPKAKKALRRLQEALDDSDIAHERWSTVFGEHFPEYVEEEKQQAINEGRIKNIEQFIGQKFSLDIQYNLRIDCSVKHEGDRLRNLMSRVIRYRIPKERELTFWVAEIDVPPPFKIYWKVKNVGPLAIEQNMIRGNIQIDSGQHQITERSSFQGDHYVECFAVKENVCVARGRIDVPI
ncbi:Nucleotidyltransferase domain protein [Pseudomonas syringae pv. maculicola]|uniref:SMODS domain-containing nucleotidyltransferase n=1 Tax=Pseudomonas syringae group genomosp. 3 TaxID=251701 RepID=UPI000EFF8AB2|nr:nucleotidyltransferase [Pseudomonas syringae group genomosp. 3]MBM0210517.1 nucleotidyltransferase [Pseudomonas syringae pv. maculicola]RMM81447.1 Nucleotidyltransferase domain protein [Pseudomonas syringae pv. maculicola]